MPEASGEDFGTLPSTGPLVFVSDESPEGERIGAVLRARGYSVADIPHSRLVEKVQSQRPALVICEIEGQSGIAALRELGKRERRDRVHLMAVGERSRSLTEHADELRRIALATFERPVDTYALLRQVEDLLGAPRSLPEAPPEPPGQWSPPRALPASRWNARLGYGSGSGIQPSPRSESASKLERPRPQIEISTELSEVLRQAEQRLEAVLPRITSVPEKMSPEEELDTFLPPDILAALEEPISSDEDADESEPYPRAGGAPAPRFGENWKRADPPVRNSGAGSSRAHTKAMSTNPGTGESTGSMPDEYLPDPGAREPPFAAVARRPATFPPSKGSADEPLENVPTMRPGADAVRVDAVRRTTAKDKLERWPRVPIESEPLPGSTGGRSAAAATVNPVRERATPRPPNLTQGWDSSDSRRSSGTEPPSASAGQVPLDLPPTLGPGDTVRALAQLVRARYTGAIAFEDPAGIHRIVLRDGDFVTAASGADRESLASFLVQRGALSADAARRLGRRIPHFGRHAGAALIAHGQLRQDELWPVLRAHAEWLIGHILMLTRGAMSLEGEIPARLRSEPAVFGGATGAEVLVEVVRRVVPPEVAIQRIGSQGSRLVEGRFAALLGECGLPEHELVQVEQGRGSTLETMLEKARVPDFAPVLYALMELGVLGRVLADTHSSPPSAPRPPQYDELDEEAQRAKILARRALVEDGDYFAVLGLAKSATAYDIRRAYLELKREFEPARALGKNTADLRDDLDVILEVIDEAYEILRDQTRRERYRRALEALPDPYA